MVDVYHAYHPIFFYKIDTNMSKKHLLQKHSLVVE